MTLRIVHLIAGLPTGGAEMMLYKLLSGTRHESLVVSMTDRGPMAPRIEGLGVPVVALGMPRGVPSPSGLLRLHRLLREYRPHLLQTWMYHADLIGGVAGRIAGGIPVVWNIRQSTLDLESSKRHTVWTFWLAARLSRFLPDRIVCCSTLGERQHVANGYAPDKIRLIPNGFDLSAYRPDPEARMSVRAELGVPPEAPLLGLVARFDPQKDHRNFLAAAGRLGRVRPESHFLLCGHRVTPEEPDLVQWTRDAGLSGRVHLLGRRDDIPRLTAALDIATSSSYQEGFANVVGEAMACGVPCVVTDVGDSADIVGTTGRVVPARDPGALAEAWQQLLALSDAERRELGRLARSRVRERFSLERVIREYEDLYETLVAEKSPCAG